MYLLKHMSLYIKYNNNYLGTKWYDFGYEMAQAPELESMDITNQ